MIITQLETLDFPKDGRAFKRMIAALQKRARRSIKSNFIKLRSKSRAIVRRQYFLTHAATDTKTAVRLNEDIFIASLMAAVVIGYSAAAIAFELFMLFLQTAYDLAEISGISMPVLTVIAMGVMGVLGGWVTAFLVNNLSISLLDGINRKLKRSIRQTFSKSLRFASRTASIWFTLLLVMFGPLLLAAIIGLEYIKAAGIPQEEVLSYLPNATRAAVTWVVFMVMFYGLTPQVGLFEPDLNIRQVFRRSRQLVSRRGHLFILFGFLFYALSMLGIYKFAELLYSSFGTDKVLTTSAGGVTAFFAFNCIMVMLYRKRKLARIN